MNEETIMTAMPEDTAPETDSTGAMEDDWDDIDFSDVKDDDTEGAEQEETPASETETPEADQQGEGEGQEEQKETPADADDKLEEQTFDLKFLGETKTVNRDEVITLAQKGLNHDRVVQERDTLKADLEMLGGLSVFREYKEFLDELAGASKCSIDDVIDRVRATNLAEKENLDPAIALQRVKLDRREKAFEAKQSKENAEKKAKEDAEKAQSQDLLRFIQEYPNVQPQDIPKEVWDKVHKEGVSLVSAYSAFENKKLRQEVQEWKSKFETAEQNAKNKERSTGSQATAGAGSPKKKDPIDEDWYSGD